MNQLLETANVPLRHAHDVQFYSNDLHLCDTVADFFAAGMRAGQPVVFIGTAEHRTLVRDRVMLRGYDFDEAVRLGELTYLDAHETLSRFMIDGRPNRIAFNRVIGGLVAQVSADRPVTAFGEMVDILWRNGNGQSAIELEELWNDLATRYNFALLCGYDIRNFSTASAAHQFKSICDLHRHVIPPTAID